MVQQAKNSRNKGRLGLERLWRWAPGLLVLAGLVVLLFACMVNSGAALPYPDPTPALLQQQRAEIAASSGLAWRGAGLALGGLLWLVARWGWRRVRRP